MFKKNNNIIFTPKQIKKDYLKHYSSGQNNKIKTTIKLKQKVHKTFLKIYKNFKYKILYLKKLKKKEKWFNYYNKILQIRKKYKLKKKIYNKYLHIVTPKYFKKVEHVFKKKRIKGLILNKLNLPFCNRIIYLHKIYNKYNKKYFYYKNKIKKIKKIKKRKLNFNIYLWNSLNLKNFSNLLKFNNYIDTTNIYIDDKFNKLLTVQNNYLKKKTKLKKNIFYSIFKKYNFNIFFKNRYKVKQNDNKKKLVLNYKVKHIEQYFNIFLNFKKLFCFDQYFNFFFNKNIKNYLYNFYIFIKFSLLNNVKVKLKVKNYYNFLIESKTYKHSEFYNTFNIYNIKVNALKKNFIFNNNIKKKINNSTLFLIKKKKWSNTSITKPFTNFFKKMIANNLKLNYNYNINYLLKIKKKKINYVEYKDRLKDKRPFKNSKYSVYYYHFLKKYNNFVKTLSRKFSLYNKYILKKYNFFISFINYYLSKIYLYIKNIFYNNYKNLNFNILKLKFLMCYMYYKMFLRFKKIKKKTKRKIFKNFIPVHNLIYVYKRLWNTWLLKKKKKWHISKVFVKKQNSYNNKLIKFFVFDPNFKFIFKSKSDFIKHKKWAQKKKQKFYKLKFIYLRKVKAYIKSKMKQNFFKNSWYYKKIYKNNKMLWKIFIKAKKKKKKKLKLYNTFVYKKIKKKKKKLIKKIKKKNYLFFKKKKYQYYKLLKLKKKRLKISFLLFLKRKKYQYYKLLKLKKKRLKISFLLFLKRNNKLKKFIELKKIELKKKKKNDYSI